MLTFSTNRTPLARPLRADPQTPDPAVKKDVDRFLWNYLAFATAGKLGDAAATGAPAAAGVPGAARCQALNATACPPGDVCAGSRGVKGCVGGVASGRLASTY